jgi:hypothetical protein
LRLPGAKRQVQYRFGFGFGEAKPVGNAEMGAGNAFDAAPSEETLS